MSISPRRQIPVVAELFLTTLLGLCLSIPTVQAAGEDGDVRDSSQITISATRTSPFDPPDTDTFVSDDGPGLDTGCTFNTDPNAPLVIDVVIDKFVGDVDANGFLLNPGSLVAAGILPGSVDIIMPAFDVDVNGFPPPESDQVLFNGESLGFLSGDNEIWKLNNFSVDIGKVKFPSRPAPGGSVTPVTNRVQINIDTLSTGRWCTSIDWVALVIPIRPKLALDLTVIGGNQIRENTGSATIDVIYQQEFDADCNVTTTIGPIDDYPFSGPATSGLFGWFSGESKLRAKLKICPENSIDPPDIKAEWSVGGGGPTGTNTWNGFEGDVTVKMPGQVGSYTVDFDYTINDTQHLSASRKLFVTKATPLGSVNPPRLAWYEKATLWASGQSDDAAIISGVLNGLYAYGGGNWRYGYSFGAATKCNWEDLMADPITCNYSDCYVFSDVLENITGTLGVGGLSAVTVLGSSGRGFLTNASPSLDPAFPGSARPLGGGAYDRYVFSSHSLRKRGLFFPDYYDATFDGIYGSDTQFISANMTGARAVDGTGRLYAVTAEGARIYGLPGNSYDSWGNYEYTLPPPPSPIVITAAATELQFPGTATYRTLDANGDGIYEGIAADIDVEALAAGTYSVEGQLSKNGVVVADRPSNESMLFSRVTFEANAPGVYKVTLTFSGEQIYQSQLDGPYDLLLIGITTTGTATATLQTPAYDYRSFGEALSRITAASDSGLDQNSDGVLEGIAVNVSLDVRTTGNYRLQGSLMKAGNTLVTADAAVTLTPGQTNAALVFPGLPLRRANVDGPYEAVVSLVDVSGHAVSSIEFLTQPYAANSFGAVVELDGTFTDQGVDSNGNGLYDSLVVTFGASFSTGGTFLLTGTLGDTAGTRTVFSEQLVTVTPGVNQQITLEFAGPDIYGQRMNGPYRVEVTLRDPASQTVIDRVALPQETQAYQYTQFDPTNVTQAIMLLGTSSDQGVDTDGNGLYNELRVNVDVQLAASGVYEWSARLVDSNGIEIGFYTKRTSLSGGKTAIDFVFDGTPIGNNGVDGPYFVKGLLMYGGGGNLVATDVAETAAYQATQFEGYVPQNQPPVANAGSDQTVECTSPAGALVTLDGSASYDPDQDPLTYTWSGPFGTANGPTPTVTCALGTSTITLTVKDDKGEEATDAVVITVVDQTPPTIAALTAMPDSLWPPQHQMVPVSVSVSAEDICSVTTSCKIVSVESNEPISGTGSGDTEPDWQITGDLTVDLRAERAGTSGDRIYTITVECIDASGNSSQKRVDVVVPHDKGG